MKTKKVIKHLEELIKHYNVSNEIAHQNVEREKIDVCRDAIEKIEKLSKENKKLKKKLEELEKGSKINNYDKNVSPLCTGLDDYDR